MEQKQVEKIIEELFIKHNLVDYKFQWMKKLVRWGRAGQCNWKKKIIMLQPTFVEKNNLENITNTILHEIAHALTPKHGHNKFWKRKAIEIGCTGLRCYSKEVIK